MAKLGEYIEKIDIRNTDLNFGIDMVIGISNNKKIMATKANVESSDLKKFYIISPRDFIYNSRTTRMGDKVGLGFNDSKETYLTSFNNTPFKVSNEAHLLPEYLYMYFNRPEFDRYARCNSWGSSTELFSWDDMCDIEIDLPDIETQRRFVAVYKALLANQRAYEKGLDDLKLTCDAYIENLRREMLCEKIGSYIERLNKRNENDNKKVLGLSTLKEFRIPHATVNHNDLLKYKVVQENEFAFVPTTDTWKVFAFGLNKGNGEIVVSPIYEVFRIKNNSRLLPEYLAMWFKRKEFDRYARYNSWGSARENFMFEDLCEVEIPIPPIATQQCIVDIYNAYIKRREINERLKQQIKEVCPILIRGSIKN
jgi:type I restriction enzyme S subunit